MQSIITYNIVSDEDDLLKNTAKTSCNFWNRFVIPKLSIILRLGVFTSEGFTIARAYKPYTKDESVYGIVEFNTKYLSQFDHFAIVGTLIHEIGHTLGIGWDVWETLFYSHSGEFKPEFIKKLPELQHMLVETDYGPGTQYSHWDEERFDEELMTGIKDNSEYVLPVTIKIMKLLGHQVIEELPIKTDLGLLMQDALGLTFSRAADISDIDLTYFKETELMEEFYIKGR
jgi:hypothetical protein